MSERPRMELTPEQSEEFKRMAFRRWPPGTPEAEAALMGSWAEMLAHGIEESEGEGEDG